MDSLLTAEQLVVLACAPVVMVVVSMFERRWGPGVAGTVAAAPFTALIGLLLVHADLGESASHDMALKMSGYVPAQVGVAAVVVTLVVRVGYPGALVAGIAAFAALTTLAAHLPIPAAVVMSGAVLIAGRRLVPTPVQTCSDVRDETEPAATVGVAMVALRATASLGTALTLLVTARQFGTAAGGAIGAFPIFTFTLCSFLYATAGAFGVRQVLAGMVRGLVPYFAFVLTFGLFVQHVGAVATSLLGALVCACCYLLPATASGLRERSRRASEEAVTPAQI